jgi:hypothetical protein
MPFVPNEAVGVVTVVSLADVVATFDDAVGGIDPDLSENFSNFAIMCFPYVYFRNELTCGRILCKRVLR